MLNGIINIENKKQKLFFTLIWSDQPPTINMYLKVI